MMPEFTEFYEVTHWSNLTEFHEDFLGYQAALVDLSFITESFGENFIELLRQRGFLGSIIVFSADESIQTKIRLLGLGVHDYLWKTMATKEVLLRIANSIQRSSDRSDSVYRLADLQVDLITQRVALNSAPISLTRSEFRLLVQLLRSRDHRCNFIELCDSVWEQSHVDRGAQDTLVWKLNKKLQDWAYRVRREGDIFELISREPTSAEPKVPLIDRLLAMIQVYTSPPSQGGV